MTSHFLSIINDAMAEMGLNYELARWSSEPVYPYFVGEYTETPIASENGLQEATFILSGFSRTTREALEDAKASIENYFDRISGKVVVADNGNATAIFYDNAIFPSTGDAELKKMEITLNIKEWKVT